MKNAGILIYFTLLFTSSCAQEFKSDLVYKVHLPAKITNTTPVLILLHGYGSYEADLFDFGARLDSRFITFSLRAPQPVREGGYCWFPIRFSQGAPFKYSYDEAIVSRKMILKFIKDACSYYKADSSQVYILGFSQGAIMALDIAISSPVKIKGIAALSGRLLPETTKYVADSSLLKKVKFFIAHGRSDNVIAAIESENARKFLLNNNVNSITYKIYDMPHTISNLELNDIRQWIQRSVNEN
jgi:phospholipase/carboxylesterase